MLPALVSFLLDDDTHSLCLLERAYPGVSDASMYDLYLGAREPCTPNPKGRGWDVLGGGSAEYSLFREKWFIRNVLSICDPAGLVSLMPIFVLFPKSWYIDAEPLPTSRSYPVPKHHTCCCNTVQELKRRPPMHLTPGFATHRSAVVPNPCLILLLGACFRSGHALYLVLVGSA